PSLPHHSLHLYYLTTPRQPTPTLFPYTTLFRSLEFDTRIMEGTQIRAFATPSGKIVVSGRLLAELASEEHILAIMAHEMAHVSRSEEHTSELQSRENLVCRLLLEKKKKQQRKST